MMHASMCVNAGECMCVNAEDSGYIGMFASVNMAVIVSCKKLFAQCSKIYDFTLCYTAELPNCMSWCKRKQT